MTVSSAPIREAEAFFINGDWVKPHSEVCLEVINPAKEQAFGSIIVGDAKDVDAAVSAAANALNSWARTSLQERTSLVRRIAQSYERRVDEMAGIISAEMGAPITRAREEQAAVALSHIEGFLQAIDGFSFEEIVEDDSTITRCVKEPIGVCALITPWNWPMSQVSLKVIPALLSGCTVVLKPSEEAPFSSTLFAEILHEAGCPAGVFNLVHGDGATTGTALTTHPDVRLISFTGSTRGGISVSQAAAADAKRVLLELGGKSPNILFADTDLKDVVDTEMNLIFDNTGQNCNAPSRLLVERSVYDDVVQLCAERAHSQAIDLPSKEGRHMGPLSSAAQFDKVQRLIKKGESEARLVTGGTGRPDGCDIGYFVRPTIFADVENDMEIAREEIFGPVLCILPFDSEEEAVAIANDTPYGLAAFVQTHNKERIKRLEISLQAGMVQINGSGRAAGSPFGGMKLSGTAREGGKWGIDDFLITKSISTPRN